jgi:sulfide:quinone oxidoreductase
MGTDRHHIVIAGGGVAALEALLALRALVGHRLQVTLVSPEREFVYRPVTVAEPFGEGEARAYAWRELLADTGGGELIWDSLESVRPGERVAFTGSGDTVAYETLIVATGALLRAPLSGALTFRGRADVPALKSALDELVSGAAGSVALTMPSAHLWPLPIYELALMTSGYLRRAGGQADVWLLTPENEPLALFGPEAASVVRRMLQQRDIRLQTSSRAVEVRDGSVTLAGGGQIRVDRVVTLPELVGPSIPGLPLDDQGFIRVDDHGRMVGLRNVYAAGDATAFPLKQGGLAAQQADAVAEAIAAGLGVPITPEPFRPVLRGLLMTGGAPLYLRAEPQRLLRGATPTEAHRARRTSAAASAVSGKPLWWPPAKVAGRYLAPFLATARPQPLSAALLADRIPVPAQSTSDTDYEDALELALLLADCDARWGDFDAALHALDAAQALHGALPSEYEAKRREWTAAARVA